MCTCDSHGMWLNCMLPGLQVTTGLGFFLGLDDCGD